MVNACFKTHIASHSTLDVVTREGGGEGGSIVADDLAVELLFPVDGAHLFPEVHSHNVFLHPARDQFKLALYGL